MCVRVPADERASERGPQFQLVGVGSRGSLNGAQ
jgi:hypothetical protein